MWRSENWKNKNIYDIETYNRICQVWAALQFTVLFILSSSSFCTTTFTFFFFFDRKKMVEPTVTKKVWPYRLEYQSQWRSNTKNQQRDIVTGDWTRLRALKEKYVMARVRWVRKSMKISSLSLVGIKIFLFSVKC